MINNRDMLLEIHIADIHFGAMDPEKEYQILYEQFLVPISKIKKIDIISVDGDLFDRKLMAGSLAVQYACTFIYQLVQLCKDKNTTLVLLAGTASHQDPTQLKLFYHYLDDPTIDIRIVETIRFEYIKGAKILCIPELYSIDESVYKHFFFESGYYDEVFVHGTCKGAVFGDNVGTGRLLTEKDFIYCRGMVISGHVHKPGCFFGWYYYTGCPIRYKFGEEEPKGYLLVAHDLNTHIHHVEFEEITSFRYDTIFIDQLISEDPKVIIDYINNLKTEQNIDFIKVKFRYEVPGNQRTIINNYYRNNSSTTIEFTNQSELKELEDNIANNITYNYLLDSSISDLERFVMYVNQNEGEQFITVEQLTSILSDIL